MPEIKKRDYERMRRLHAMTDPEKSNPQEKATAEKKLCALLKRLGKNWTDLPKLMAEAAAVLDPPPPSSDPRDATPAPDVGANIFPPDLIIRVMEDYVELANPHDFVAIALWAIHTHVHAKFMVTPRLVLTSPVYGCGKTTMLDVLSTLVAKPEKADSITAAGIYHAVDIEHCTLLLDEADNLELGSKAVLRATINSGHRKGGTRMHMIRGQLQHFSTFAPVALAAIGKLTLPLMSRSIVIRMSRAASSTHLHHFDRSDTSAFDTAYRSTIEWVRSAVLNPKPEMPVEVYGRAADNWRPLIAIADACSPAWGIRAREAAVHFARAYRDEPIAVTLLRDIRKVFDLRHVDRITSEDLVKALLAMEDAPWNEWTGARGDQSPRKISQGQLAVALSDFIIRPKSIRLPGKPTTLKGYFREMFEKVWAEYCGENGTTEHRPSNVTLLSSRKRTP
jgi:Protein of unknown function (DUF3631)